MYNFSEENSKLYSKNIVVGLIKDSKKIIYTCPKGKCVDGAQVHVYTLNGVHYLRSDKDKTAKDNLEKLPNIC